MHVYVHLCINIYIWVCIHTYVYIYINYTCTHIFLYVQYIYMYLYIYIHIYICIYIYIYSKNVDWGWGQRRRTSRIWSMFYSMRSKLVRDRKLRRPLCRPPYLLTFSENNGWDEKMSSKLNFFVRDSILFVGCLWRATADLIRRSVF